MYKGIAYMENYDMERTMYKYKKYVNNNTKYRKLTETIYKSISYNTKFS